MDKNIIISIVIAVLLTAFFSSFAFYITKETCSSKAEKMGFECSYGIIQGCMINVEGRWLPIESYRTIK